MRREVSIDTLVTEPKLELGLAVRAGRGGLERVIKVPRIQKPGLALAGYAEQLHQERLLVIGGTEVDYLSTLDVAARTSAVATVMGANPASVVVTRGLEPPAELVEACEKGDVPLLTSSLASADFIIRVTDFLGTQLSPSTSVHGVLLDVLGVGILLLGKSGIGKSEAALDLVARGHRLVADDIVDIHLKSPSLLFGSGSTIIRHHMEIRGLGIINIKDLFGVSAVRDTKKIELVIELALWDPEAEYDRLGLDEHYYDVLGVNVPKLQLPVRPGRNIATLIEVAARNQLLKFQGYNSAQVFQEQLNKAIAEAKPQTFEVDIIE